MCLYPRLIQNKKYTANKKNGGRIPPVSDIRTTLVPIGCGKCIECMKQKARNWQVRLSEEIKNDKTGQFVTLTFNEESLQELERELDLDTSKHYMANDLATVAVRRFLERWRKKHKISVKHWLITELGHNGTERLHLHGLIFTDKPNEIADIWSYGFVFIGNMVNEKTINYIIKYIHKIDQDHKEYKPKTLCSKGIGSNYTNRLDSKKNKYKAGETNETYRTGAGLKLALPIYYRNKIYTEDEREKLWLEKLDKEERWVCGERVDVSQSDEEYENLLKFYRAKNKRLGYGDDAKNWEEQEYKLKLQKLKKRKQDDKLRNLIVKNNEKDLDNTNNKFRFAEILNKDNDFLKWDL